jgi:hypothetical protein
MSYAYRNTIKSELSDELINTYAIRPFAGMIVRMLYRTSVSPNQLTMASIAAGFAAAVVYLQNSASAFILAGLLVTCKDILDSADGQLARAKNQFSRSGRFLDSIGDFLVNAALFSAIGKVLFEQSGMSMMYVIASAGFAGTTLRVSYHVYYQTRFLHLHEKYENNRITEDVRIEDVERGGRELQLQRIFQIIYGWQDRLMLRIDLWCLKGIRHSGKQRERWYTDVKALRLSGLLGLGTELFLLTVCSLFNRLFLYCILNIIMMNGIFLASVLYRKFILSRTLYLDKEKD